MSALDRWTAATADLQADVSRLQQAVAQRGVSLVRVRLAAVEESYKVAVQAASAVAAAGLTPPTAVQTGWVAVLSAMAPIMQNARQLIAESPSANGGNGMLDAGARIPGTNIVVPWAAVLGILAVGGVAWWVTRRRRVRKGA